MEYIVTFTANGYKESFDIKNIDEYLTNGFLIFQSKEFASVFVEYNNEYKIKAILESFSVSDGGKDISVDTQIYDGMYIIARSVNNESSYQLLFQSKSKIVSQHQFYKLSEPVLIGRGNNVKIKITINDSISREHAIIEKQGEQHIVKDLSNKAGIYLNGYQVKNKELQIGDILWCMGVSVVYMGDFIGVSSNANVFLNPHTPNFMDIPNKITKVDFERAPRVVKSLEIEEFEIDPPTAKPVLKQIPAILTVGPSLTMSMAMMVSLGVAISNATTGNYSSVITSGAMACSMLMGATLWPTLLRKYNKKQQILNEEIRLQKYSQYTEKKSVELNAKYERNQEVWNDILSPEPMKLIQFANDYQTSARLWERTINDNDFLNLRVGVGEHDFEVDIKIPKIGFEIDDDELKKYPKAILEKFKTIKNVPEVINLPKDVLVGIFGEKDLRFNLIKSLAIETMALHSPDEVKTVFVFSEHERENFTWVKDLPSVWSNDKSVRFMATTQDEAHTILTYIDERTNPESKNNEHYLFFITNNKLVENENLNRHIQNPESKLPIYSIFTSEKMSGLPKNCKTIIRAFAGTCGIYSKSMGENKYVKFAPDDINEYAVEKFKKILVNIPMQLELGKLGIATKVGFLEMYKSGNVENLQIEDRWLNNRSDKSLATPIGLSFGDEVFNLDIHESYHGCHGLVAGTTGSGKTEFLQEFILSMMVNYSPNEVSFVLVDFKGGDMARPFMKNTNTENGKNEHHISATITNLSSNMLYRALVSLKAEIKFRQTVFNESAVLLDIDKIDINSYHKYFKDGKLTQPLPHLVVVIDEFAQLKSQFPEFLQELINVAQVGRSLGIHLILATQKPSGVVDPQIWSNSRFKVCLKVAEKQDSMEMIGVSNSASIKQPGRCFVQVGYDELFAEVQTGYSGLPYVSFDDFIRADDITVDLVDYSANTVSTKKIKIAQDKTGKTQIEAVVAKLVEVGNKLSISTKQLWCDLLPEVISLDYFDSAKLNSKEVVIGLLDEIKTQSQKMYTLDFDKLIHTGIYGMSGKGKTTLLQTIMYQLFSKNTVEEVQAYIFDFAGSSLKYFSNVENIKGYCDVNDINDINDLLDELLEETVRRKSLFLSSNCTSFTDYVRKEKLANIIVIIDNYAPFHDKYYQLESKVQDVLLNSISCGFTFLIASPSKNGIPMKIADNIGQIISFKMPDKLDYKEMFRLPAPIIPEDIEGRCLVEVSKELCELQVPLIIKSENEAQRIEYITSKLKMKPIEFKSKTVKDVKTETKSTQTKLRNQISMPKLNVKNRLKSINIEEIPLSNGLFVGGNNKDEISDLIFGIYEITNPKITITKKDNFKNAIFSEADIDKAINSLEGMIKAFNEVIILIECFSEFFDIISDDGLDKLTLLLKTNPDKIKVITGDVFTNLKNYTVAEFYYYSVKQKQIILTNPQNVTEQLPFLNGEISIPNTDNNIEGFLHFNDDTWSKLEV